jgi:hypothetical protein
MKIEQEKKMRTIRKLTRMVSMLLVLLMICLVYFPSFQAAPTLLECDINDDGIINTLDLIEVSNYLGTKGNAGWIKEDVDNNGVIQVCDLMLVANNYGKTVSQNAVAHIQKLSIAYGTAMSDSTDQNFIANHFNMVDCSSTDTDAAANVKALNSKIKILGYFDSIMMSKSYSDWSTVNSHETWFAHSLSGSRIERVSYPGQYLMNPNSGWSSYLAQKWKSFLTNNPQYDGIFADDATSDLQFDGYTFKVSYSQFGTGILSNWESWMDQHIQTIKTSLGSDLLMPNAYKYTDFCQSSTHVHFWENFIHGRSSAYNENGYGTNGWNYGLLAIDALHDQAELGNIIAVNSGCEGASSHPTEAKRWMLFTYACFAFAVVDVNKAYYSWQFYNDDSTHGYYPEMDMNLGQPVGDYYHVSGTAQVYARQFSNYYVAANLNLLGTGSVTFTLNGASHTLAPRTAIFIAK